MWQPIITDVTSLPYYGEDIYQLRVYLESRDPEEESALWDFIKRTEYFLYENHDKRNILYGGKRFPLKKPSFLLTPIEVFLKSPPLQRRKLFFKTLRKGDILYLKVIRDEGGSYKLQAIDRHQGCMKIDDCFLLCELPKLPQEMKHLYPPNFSVIRAAFSSLNVRERKLIVTFDQSVVPSDFQDVPLGPIYEEYCPHYFGNPFLGVSLTDNMFMTEHIRLRGRTPEFSIIGIDENKCYSHCKFLNNMKYSPELSCANLKKSFDRATSTHYYKLAVNAIDKGRVRQALSHLKLALYLWNEYPEALLLAGRCYNIIGDHPSAFMCTMKVYEEYPNVGAARKQMCIMLVDAAKVHISYNNKTLARESLEMARIIDPENENAKRLLYDAELLNNDSSLINSDEKYGIPNPFEDENIDVSADAEICPESLKPKATCSTKPKRRHHRKKSHKSKQTKHPRHPHRPSNSTSLQEISVHLTSPLRSNLPTVSSNIQSETSEHSNSPKTPRALPSSASTSRVLTSSASTSRVLTSSASPSRSLTSSYEILKNIKELVEKEFLNETRTQLLTKMMSIAQDLAKQSGNNVQPNPLSNPLLQYSHENVPDFERIHQEWKSMKENQLIQEYLRQQIASMPELGLILQSQGSMPQLGMLQSHFFGPPNLVPGLTKFVPPNTELPMHSDIQWKVPAVPPSELPSLSSSAPTSDIAGIENPTIPAPIHITSVPRDIQTMPAPIHSANVSHEIQTSSNQSLKNKYHSDISQGNLQIDTSCLPSTSYQPKSPDTFPKVRSVITDNTKTSEQRPYSHSTPVLPSSSNLLQKTLPSNLKTKFFKPISSGANQSLTGSCNAVKLENTPKSIQNVHNERPSSSFNANLRIDRDRSPSIRHTPKRYQTPSPPKKPSNVPPPKRYKSPPKRQRSKSPRKNRSPSPRRNRSPSPRRNRSPSPRRNRSPSPRRNRSRSPRRNRSPSPRRNRSPSPRKYRSSLRERSYSPRRSRSQSPTSRGRSYKTAESRNHYQKSHSSRRSKGFYQRSSSRSRNRSKSPSRRSRSISPRSYRSDKSRRTQHERSYSSYSKNYRPTKIKREPVSPLPYEMSDVVVSSPSPEPYSPPSTGLFRHNTYDPHLLGVVVKQEASSQFERGQSPPWQRHVSIVDKPKDYSSPSSSGVALPRQRFGIKREPSPERSIPVICSRTVSYK